ncbi:zinc-binding alcohol dehydrogenase family protein [uncultured Friedmanniella sp.]|uniref:zinc-binding alcohol dehydrogenase family protein n=1 Tax=uncultured Friedmanniella sp. TaxID=335381 RepID=UPI0035CA0DF9
MKAAVVRSAGSGPVYGEFDEPVVAADQTLVSLVAAGIHPVVRSVAGGGHYASAGTWPLIPGLDAVARTAEGTLVYTGYVRAPYGTFAERMAVPAGLGFPLPADADPVPVAAGVNPGLSSWLPLRARAAEVERLGTVLILGVTGAAGRLAVQNALAVGAERVVGVGRNPEGLARAGSMGAEALALTGDVATDTAAMVEALAGQAPTLVLDFVWGDGGRDGLRGARTPRDGEDTADVSYVEIGAMSGAKARVPAALLRSRRLRISGSGVGSTPLAVLGREIPAYLELIANGAVTVAAQAYDLADVATAWAAASDGGPRPVVVAPA